MKLRELEAVAAARRADDAARAEEEAEAMKPKKYTSVPSKVVRGG